MPVVAITTAANGDERQQVLPMLDRIRVATRKRGNPKRRPRVLAADKGYDARWLRHKLRSKGIRPQIKQRQWHGKKLKVPRHYAFWEPEGAQGAADQSRMLYPATSKSGLSLGFNVNTGG